MSKREALRAAYNYIAYLYGKSISDEEVMVCLNRAIEIEEGIKDHECVVQVYQQAIVYLKGIEE